jgi:hypothetical protein
VVASGLLANIPLAADHAIYFSGLAKAIELNAFWQRLLRFPVAVARR